MTRREQERALKRQLILDTAKLLFAKKSYYHTTIEEIATEAELAKGTVYNFFVSKEDLLVQVYLQELELLNSWMIKELQFWSSAVLTRLAERLMQFNKQTGTLVFPLHAVMFQAEHNNTKASMAVLMHRVTDKQKLLADYFSKGVSAKAIDSRYEVDLMAMLFDQKIFGLAFSQEHNQHQQVEGQGLDVIIECFMYGVATKDYTVYCDEGSSKNV